MRKMRFLGSALTLILSVFTALAMLSCGNAEMPDEAAVKEIAFAMANQDNGLSAEVNDNLSLAAGSGGETYVNRTFVITTSNGQLNGFSWNSASNAYIRTASNLTVVTSGYTGILDNGSVSVQYFESVDASGTPVQLTNPHVTNNPNVKSSKYHRYLTGSVTSIATGITRYFTITSDLVITGVNDGVDGVFVSVNRTKTVNVTNGSRTGSWSIVITGNNIEASRSFDGTSYYTAMNGTVNVSFNGVYTGPRGTRTVQEDRVVTFNRQRTVTITADNSTITIDVSTGDIQ